MTVTIHHAQGYSKADHFGLEIVHRAGEYHLNVVAARAAVARAIAEMPESCASAGAPRIVWSRGNKSGII
jgi:hypothetical protein